MNMHVYGEEHNASIERDLTLCVWNGHMRCLFPTAVTTTDNWISWTSHIDTVFNYEWKGWDKDLEHDESPATIYTLEPCDVCQQLTRIPRSNIFNPTGHEESDSDARTSDWWNEWNPWVFSNRRPHAAVVEETSDPGIGPLSDIQQLKLGWDYMPDCNHEWRSDGPLNECSTRYFEEVQQEFTVDGLQELALRGDCLIQQLGGLYPALCALQEDKFRDMADQVDFASNHRNLFPEQYEYLNKTLTQGVSAYYSGGVPLNPRQRGLPYQKTNEEHCRLIEEKLWKDVAAQRMLVCTTETVDANTPVEATPTTTVEKRNPDRTISSDRRVIADLRRVNLNFPSSQYYPVRVPTAGDIARMIVILRTQFPDIETRLTKRDVAAAFRLLRLHPALCLLMVTELPGRFFKMKGQDIVLIYLVMPFGWNGSPAHFAVFGDAITAAHCAHGIADHPELSQLPFLSRMYVDDGIFVELRQPVRMQTSTLVWEKFTRGLLGRSSINLDKMKEEGQWSNRHIILGIEFDTDSLQVRLPDAKIAGARILFEELLDKRDSQILCVKTLQQIRGVMEHFKTVNTIWMHLTAPVDALMVYGDETSNWIICPDKQVWDDFWRTMDVVETHLQTESKWRTLLKEKC